jgi:hypothetical protein
MVNYSYKYLLLMGLVLALVPSLGMLWSNRKPARALAVAT